jgi:hypothetical protein
MLLNLILFFIYIDLLSVYLYCYSMYDLLLIIYNFLSFFILSFNTISLLIYDGSFYRSFTILAALCLVRGFSMCKPLFFKGSTLFWLSSICYLTSRSYFCSLLIVLGFLYLLPYQTALLLD